MQAVWSRISSLSSAVSDSVQLINSFRFMHNFPSGVSVSYSTSTRPCSLSLRICRTSWPFSQAGTVHSRHGQCLGGSLGVAEGVRVFRDEVAMSRGRTRPKSRPTVAETHWACREPSVAVVFGVEVAMEYGRYVLYISQ